MCDLRFPTRDQTRVPCWGSTVLTTGPPGKSLRPHTLNWDLEYFLHRHIYLWTWSISQRTSNPRSLNANYIGGLQFSRGAGPIQIPFCLHPFFFFLSHIRKYAIGPWTTYLLLRSLFLQRKCPQGVNSCLKPFLILPPSPAPTWLSTGNRINYFLHFNLHFGLPWWLRQ